MAGSAVVAVGSRTSDKAEAFAAETGVPFYGTYKDVLARDDVDAVYVATTHNFHLATALEAITAGKPVLIEKPIVRNSAEFEILRAAAGEANVLVMEAMWSRFLPHYALIRALLNSGELGKVRFVRAEFNAACAGLRGWRIPNLRAVPLSIWGCIRRRSSIGYWASRSRSLARGRLTERGVDAAAVAVLDYPEAQAVYEASMDMATTNAALISCEKGWIELPFDFYRPSELRVAWNDLDEKNSPSKQYVGSVGRNRDRRVRIPIPGCRVRTRAVKAGLTEFRGTGWDHAPEVIEILDVIRHQVGVVLPGSELGEGFLVEPGLPGEIRH